MRTYRSYQALIANSSHDGPLRLLESVNMATLSTPGWYKIIGCKYGANGQLFSCKVAAEVATYS